MARKILIIDDDAAFAEMLRLALSAKNYDVSVCLHATEAIRTMLELRPDLITLDIMMPGRSGWEIIAQMRSRSETAQIPVLITTGVRGVLIPDEDILLAGIRSAKLYKPFELDDFYDKVAALLRGPAGDSGATPAASSP